MAETNNVQIEMEKIFCTKCGKELSSDDKFCPICGMPRQDLQNISNNLQNVDLKEKEIKQKTTFYKWGFIVSVMVVIAVIAFICGGSFAKEKTIPETRAITVTPSEPNESKSSTYESKKSSGSDNDIDIVISTIELLSSDYFDYYNISGNEYLITVKVSLQGIDENTIKLMLDYGYGRDEWDTVKESMMDWAFTCKDLIETSGYPNTAIEVHLVDYNNKSKSLLEVDSKRIIYDYTEDNIN